MSCFEKIADLSDPDFLLHIQPTTRNTFHLYLKGDQIRKGKFLLDAGAELLVLEWTAQRGRWIDKRKLGDADPALNSLLRNEGLPNAEPQSVTSMSQHEGIFLDPMLAPFERSGPEDTEEWNLFSSYLHSDNDDFLLYKRHHLSTILQRWQSERVRIASFSFQKKRQRGRLFCENDFC